MTNDKFIAIAVALAISAMSTVAHAQATTSPKRAASDNKKPEKTLSSGSSHTAQPSETPKPAPTKPAPSENRVERTKPAEKQLRPNSPEALQKMLNDIKTAQAKFVADDKDLKQRIKDANDE